MNAAAADSHIGSHTTAGMYAYALTAIHAYSQYRTLMTQQYLVGRVHVAVQWVRKLKANL